MRNGLLAAGITVTAVVSLTAGCGSSSTDVENEPHKFTKQSAIEILKAGLDDTSESSGLRARGTMSDGGDQLRFNIRTDQHANCAGKMVSGPMAWQVVIVEGVSYSKGNEAYWRRNGVSDSRTLLDRLRGRWVKANADLEKALSFCDIGIGTLRDLRVLERNAKVTGGEVVGLSKIDGVDVIEVTSEDDAQSFSIYVSVAAPHLIRRVALSGDVMTFSEFGSPTLVTVPSRSILAK